MHGGAWRRKMRRESLFAAEPFVQAGAGFAAIGFDALPSCTLEQMLDQVCAALGWLRASHAGRVIVCAHSSGAHLAACALTRVEGLSAALLVSGIYDLRPVRLSARNDYVRVDDRIEESLSPIRHVSRLRLPVAVAWGEHESPEFARQSADYAAALGVTGLCVPGLNHFEVIRTLAEPESRLCIEALTLIG